MRAGTCRGKKGLPHCGEKGVGAGMMREIPPDGLGSVSGRWGFTYSDCKPRILEQGNVLVVVGFRGVIYWTFMR